MLIKNNCTNVQNIGGVYVVAGQTAEVDDSFAKNPIIKAYIEKKYLEVVDTKKAANKDNKDNKDK